MASRGVPQLLTVAYTHAMSHSQTVTVCRDFSDHRLTRGTASQGLVMKGSPVRVRPSALRFSPVRAFGVNG